jgi:hypothetical protein
MSFPIHDREQRRRLDPRPKPYFVRLSDGVHVGYRKGKSVSRWVIRRWDGEDYRLETIPKIYPDDDEVADGRRFLSFQQVVAKIMTDDAKIPLKCSFCGKGYKQVAKLIAGPSIFICDECVALCQIYLDHPDQKGKLLVDKEFKPVLRDGEPVFEPITANEMKKLLERYDYADDLTRAEAPPDAP